MGSPEQRWAPAALDGAAASVEAARMAAVRRYEILDTPPDGAFDRVARLAARWFDVPIATVTIVDTDRIWFKTTHGLDGVTQIGRDPGLCGSAILSDDTYVVPDAVNDPRSCDNPLVTGDLGVRFYAAAPIVTADGHRLGTLNVIDTKPRRIDEAGMATLHDLAAVVLDELELRLASITTLREERARREQAECDQIEIEAFATTLQRTLVPPALPAVPGLHLASHYRTASPRLVGGDFYDVFALTDGRWAAVLGDVCGKGAPAAALTSFVRYTVRSLTHHHEDALVVLGELNTALRAEQSNDAHPRFATLVLLVLDPEPGLGTDPEAGISVTVAAGGHPPPYLLHPGGGIDTLTTPGGMLLGVLPDARFTARTTRLAPGETLLLYTDGLTEARTHGGDLLDDTGLEQFLVGRAERGAAALVEAIIILLESLSDDNRDDVAVLALSVPPSGGLHGSVPTSTTSHASAGVGRPREGAHR